MAKKIQKKETLPPPLAFNSKPFSLNGFGMQAIILIVLGLLFYANTFNNEYAFDDGVVILKNEYVQKGFSGISKILTRDAFDSYYKQSNAGQQLSGGRYRPLSVITFAIEQQLFGSTAKEKPENDLASLRHIVNVLLYICSVILLLYFLVNYIFKKTPLTAFVASLLFLIHPLHTEVVANIKSRDEIMSLLFILLTLIFVFRYHETKRKFQLFYGSLFYLLALLSKEYAITLLLLIPMMLYIVNRHSFRKSISSALPFLIVAIVYLALRFSAVGIGNLHENPDVINNPYKFATTPEKWATKIEILIFYVRMLFYPVPLCYDYSYNTIPYANFENGSVWLSLILHLAMIATAVVLFVKRNILSFALAFYLLHLLLVSNFILDIGATMGERLVYHSSVGFAMIIAFTMTKLSKIIVKPVVARSILFGACSLITLWCGAKVIERNREWKNDTVLFATDVDKLPNSALANGNAGMIYNRLAEKPENKQQEKQLLEKAKFYLQRAVSIHTAYVNSYVNLGVTYMYLKEYEKAKENFDIAKSLYPNDPQMKMNYTALGINYYNDAMAIGLKQPAKAFILLEKAVELVPDNADFWYYYGAAAYNIPDFEKARTAWIKTLEINPEYQKAKDAMNVLNATHAK